MTHWANLVTLKRETWGKTFANLSNLVDTKASDVDTIRNKFVCYFRLYIP
jgi:hypothetical protein